VLLTLPEIKARVDELAKKINAPSDILPTYGGSRGDRHPNIEIGSQGYYYLAIERDVVCDRLITQDIDELLFKIFVDVTFSISLSYELAHRIPNQDCRRIMFQHQVELLGLLSPEWSEREAANHREILAEHPFHDDTSL
jgi:hypothetical protein